MNRIRFIFIFLLYGFLSGSVLYAQEDVDVIEVHDSCSINWSRRVIQAKGSGVPVEYKLPYDVENKEQLTELAQTKARQNLLATILSIPLDSENLASTVIFSRNDIMGQLKAMINRSNILKKNYLTDGTVEVLYEFSFDGGFAQLLLPEEIQLIQPVRTFHAKSLNGETDSVKNDPAVSFTGMIVDTRGLTVRPSLSPKVLDATGQEVYGPAFISREYAVQKGTVYYSPSMSDPHMSIRTGAHPLVVTGLKTLGTRHSDIMVSQVDASLLHSSSAHLEFLSQCRVAIIIDKTAR